MIFYNKDIKILEVSIMKKKIAMVILATCLFGTLAGCEKIVVINQKFLQQKIQQIG